MLVLHAAVGAGAPNRPEDVRAVQAALNAVPATAGGPAAALAVDGRCGPRTMAAIARFQLQRFGWSDLRIDPGEGTARQLSTAGPARVVAGPAIPMARRSQAVRMALSGAAAEAVTMSMPGPQSIAGEGVMEATSGEVMVNGVTARRGQRLHRGDLVGTLDNASARLVLYFGSSTQGDKQEVVLGPNTVIRLLGREHNPMNAGSAQPTRLETGRLRAMLTSLAGGG